MKPVIPEIVKNESIIPLTPDRFYIISEEARDEIIEFVAGCDAIPETEWRAWADSDKAQYSKALHTAERIIRNARK